MEQTKKEYAALMKKSNDVHKTWHKFNKWLINKYGKDLYGPEVVQEITDNRGKIQKYKYKHFDESAFEQRLVGYDVMEAIEKYAKKNAPEIKIVNCDDDVHAGSILVLIPHPTMGISVMFIPQCTGIQNRFFLYGGHYKSLIKTLQEMEKTYIGDIDND